MTTDCPIAYDHSDDLGYCNVCGWQFEAEAKPYSPSWASLPKWLWPDHASAPSQPVMVCGPGCASDTEQE